MFEKDSFHFNVRVVMYLDDDHPATVYGNKEFVELLEAGALVKGYSVEAVDGNDAMVIIKKVG